MDLNNHLNADVEKTESDIEKNYHNWTTNNLEQIAKEKDAESRGLELQTAKHRGDDSPDRNTDADDIRRQIEFQNEVCKPNLEQEKCVEKRTNEATLQCYTGSLENVQQKDKLTHGRPDTPYSKICKLEGLFWWMVDVCLHLVRWKKLVRFNGRERWTT